MRPTSGFGATPIDPKNGASFSVTPGANAAVPARSSKRTRWKRTYGKSSGSVPLPGMKPLTPYGCRNSKPINLHLEHVARLGAVDEDRARHRVRAGPALGDRPLDQLQRFRDLVFLHAGGAQPRKSARDHRLDADRVAGRHAQHRLHRRIVVAPVHVLRQQLQFVDTRLRRDQRPQRHGHDEGRRPPCECVFHGVRLRPCHFASSASRSSMRPRR